MIDILNNIDKNYVVIKHIPTKLISQSFSASANIDEMSAGVILKVKDISIEDTKATVIFSVSKDNDFEDMITKLIEAEAERQIKINHKRKGCLKKIVRVWETRPEIFSRKREHNEVVYACSEKELFHRNDYMFFATGYGSNTYWSKEFYENELKNCDKAGEEELKDIPKKRKKYTRDVLNTEILIKASELELFVAMCGKTKKSSKKPPFPFVIKGEDLNEILRCMPGDVSVDDEFIEWIKNDTQDKKLVKNLEKIKGCFVSTFHEGFHHNDGQICEYTVAITTPENHEYKAYNSHCLITGWSFYGHVSFE